MEEDEGDLGEMFPPEPAPEPAMDYDSTSPPPAMDEGTLPQPRTPQTEAEPEPEGESLLGTGTREEDNNGAEASPEKLGLLQRIADLNRALEEAVRTRDFAAAWRVQREIEETQALVGRVEEFDARLAQLHAEMRERADSQDYYTAGYLQEELRHLLAHKSEMVDADTRIAALVIAALSHAQNPESLERALSTQKDISQLEKRKAFLADKDAQKAEIRQDIHAAVVDKRYADADELLKKLEQVEETREDDEETSPEEEDAKAQAAGQQHLRRPSQTQRAAGPPGATTAAAAAATSPVAREAAGQPSHDVVANLASLIWESSHQGPGSAQSVRQSPRSTLQIDPQHNRRLRNFYQKYNQSKLPSVCAALQVC